MARLTPEQFRAVADNLDVAEKAAWTMRRRHYWWCEIDDLRSWAYYGLIIAAMKYRPHWGAPFPAYAFKTACGVIIGEQRNEAHGGRASVPFDEDEEGNLREQALGIYDWDLDHV